MKQIEIDCVKEFAEKMREFGYGVSVGVTAKPAYDYKPPMHDTEIKVGCFKRAESNDALFWDDLSLSSRLCILQKPGNTAFVEKTIEQEGRKNPWKKDQEALSVNPWKKESANLTEQARIIKTRPELVIFYRLLASLDEYVSQRIRQGEGTDQHQGVSSVLKLAQELVQKFPEPSL